MDPILPVIDENRRLRHMAKLVIGGNNPAEVAKLFDIGVGIVEQAAEDMMSGKVDQLLPVIIECLEIKRKYLIYNHYSDWMIINWNPYMERWMDQNMVQVVEQKAIIIAYKLPEKPL
jgi:hypothetical protein